MSDKTDPRLDVLRGEWLEWANLLEGIERWRRLLAAFDAADRAAGIVRVDTRDEALVERLVDVAAESLRSGCPVPMCRGTHRADARLVVRAVLAALREES